jgi:hypothetical protein
MRRQLSRWLCGLFLLIAFQANADVAVITNIDSTIRLTDTQIIDLFLGKYMTVNGKRIRPVISETDEDTLRLFAGKRGDLSVSRFRISWSTLRFTGKGDRPVQVETGKDVIEAVKAHPDYVGLIHELDLTDDVRVLRIY